MDQFYIQKAVTAYEKDSNFEIFRMKAAAWTERAFELLSDKHSLYELVIKKLEIKTKSTSAAFKDFNSEKKLTIKLRKKFAKYLASSFVPFEKMAKIVRRMNPTRYFLLEVLQIEIKKLRATDKVPEAYLGLQQEYLDILEFLCASCYLLVPKAVRKIKTNKLPPEDCLAQGYEGLVMAAHRFDFERVDAKTGHPIKFATFAYWWIRARVFDAIGKNVFFLSVDCEIHNAYCRRNIKGIQHEELAVLVPCNTHSCG